MFTELSVPKKESDTEWRTRFVSSCKLRNGAQLMHVIFQNGFKSWQRRQTSSRLGDSFRIVEFHSGKLKTKELEKLEKIPKRQNEM